MAKAVHRKGQIAVMQHGDVDISDCLFDTGATGASYIHRKFVKAHRELLAPFKIKRRNSVYLADRTTRIDLEEAYVLTVSFADANGVLHTGSELFYVLPDMGHDMIVGLPAIVTSYSELHKQMIDSAVDEWTRKVASQQPQGASQQPGELANMAPDILNPANEQSDMAPGETRFPWKIAMDEEAPEDADTPLPSSFADVLDFMETPHDEAVQEFLAELESRIHPDFLKETRVLELLQTKGLGVFVPASWDGIQGFEPIELEFKPGMPDRMKPPARRINPKLYAHAKLEYDRLLKYLYRLSDSPIASCLVIAPKATAPFIRFCGDYVAINLYIVIGNHPIPSPRLELEKIALYRYIIELDAANAFHQLKIGPITSARLSVQTPWGQVEPMFLPEGVGPASFLLQEIMTKIFKGFEDWTIVIFDNILVLAHDYQDAYKKLEMVLDRCIQHNLILKLKKSKFGFQESDFFGYVCRNHSYELSQERKDSIAAFPFPTSLKKMQSFLGTANFFTPFVPHFSTFAAPLYEMAHKEFDWDPATWTKDYMGSFEGFKKALQDAVAICYPDYDREWILRTDASMFGVGGALLQVYEPEDGSPRVYQPIGFFSQKFSPQATRWSTIEQEAFGIYASVQHFSYYLRCKPFIVETDHNNLIFMEKSVVPKIVRWRVLLQAFVFLVRHISGKLNSVADWLSRWEDRLPDAPDSTLAALQLSDAPPASTPEEALAQVHGGRMGHHGARRTWLDLCKHFPGHQIPYQFVAEYVATCPICQKLRLDMVDGLAPVVRHLKPAHSRSTIGIDTLTVTPPDEEGYCYLIVIVNHFTKFAYLYPSKNKEALSVAHAVFGYVCHFGLVDIIMTDPGTEFKNELLATLTKWLGVRC
jgi:hypothetical protein